MSRPNVLTICAMLLALPLSAIATPISVTYDIGPYVDGGYSASWLHTASGCTGVGPDSGDTLYMCGYAKSLTGTVSGTLDDGIFTIDGGNVTVFGTDFSILSGSLGGDFTNTDGDLLWFLEIAGFGTFFFESVNMGATGPNYFDGNEFVLWGQNSDAYACDSYSFEEARKQECMPWGIDLYATSVPEPGTLVLFGAGLFAMGMAGRRRRTVPLHTR